jgi:membrane protein required for colicin V production
MSDFTIFDYIYIAVAIGSTIWAFVRGGVYELVATLSWIVAAITSRFVSPSLNIYFQELFKLPEPTVGTLVASYFLVFFGVLVIFGLFNQRLRDWIQGSILQITDRTLGIIFGVLRGIAVMGLVYWTMLWYYEDSAKPTFLTAARTRPMMQVAAVKMNEWFIPGKNELLERDQNGTKEAQELYNNLIDPAIKAASTSPSENKVSPEKENEGVGYKESERNALENQLLQIDNLPVAE